METIAIICLVMAGCILAMAVAKFEYSRNKRVTAVKVESLKGKETALCLTCLAFYALVAFGVAVLWLGWNFIFASTLQPWGHGLLLFLWVSSCYQLGARLGVLVARF